ncbi:hypothetical protein BDW59DRAFT_167334 [Aspergillus cavernicola]|uniref:Polyketide synthase n=1 Tax=Aspergillus cavernicola TaxID=176166 RepID=A0ABR4HEM6_9EURO
MEGKTILLFGPQALSFREDSLHQLRETIREEDGNGWVADVVAELPAYWKRFAEKLPKLRAIAGEKLLGDLNVWLKTGQAITAAGQLPNILLSPLVVITQLTQYSKYLTLSSDGSSDQDRYSAVDGVTAETVGFCTGLLSALAVSSAANRAQFQQYASAAVRLAALIGGLVDTEDLIGQHKESTSFATVWNSEASRAEMTRILEQFSEAYISVQYDTGRATVTTAASTASTLQSQLRAAGIIATEVGLRGRFHYEQYKDDVEFLTAFCDTDPALHFSDADRLVRPSRGNGGKYIAEGKLHQIAASIILLEQSHWYQTFAAVHADHLHDKAARVICFGPERCVPPSLLRGIGSQLIYMADPEDTKARLAAGITKPRSFLRYPQGYSENDIAVVGYSCKVAGADSVEEFWQLLCEGKSQHVEVPQERVKFESQWRETDSKRKWFGNFMRDPDAYDHRFFRKSPREATSQDPQQRLMMQIAYQAVEQSGYWNAPSIDQNVGCYIGVCATDYENNIACYPANAFSATGNLRSFIAGKISHYFGWTGPGLTIDTACSASAVAIHQACRAILGGDCTAALAGGVSVMTNPLWFQNLAGASFLSPTGACKPFDAKADGYCRGEGVAAVFLKKMSQAVADGDVIHGCIKATAVNQNENCTPIFVPNTPSLSGLFEKVTHEAGLQPNQITVVEAHGTGTPVGDPAEYESVLRVLGGPRRTDNLAIGSVKGLIGHTEATSGVMALIKILLMIEEGKIPPQASFETMNPHIKASATDHMEIVTRLKPWEVEYKAALINNYGASGSNASLVVGQPTQHAGAGRSPIHSAGVQHPFWLTGFNEKSIRDYAIKLRQFLQSKVVSHRNLSVANLSFNVSRQSNRTLDKALIFSAASLQEVEEKLAGFIDKNSSLEPVSIEKPARPVVLCFGGQISTFIGLDRKVYDSVRVLRRHLDYCNSTLIDLGRPSIYPKIFQASPISDTVELQAMLFAIQYSVAKTWIDCGVPVAAVVGHSFGELTALCISGVLSPRVALRVITARAQLVRDRWGSDSGSMMAVEGDLGMVQDLLREANKSLPDDANESPAVIACYNGPRSFTLAGSTTAIDAVVETVSKSPVYSSMRTKRLTVTNAFHSPLVAPLLSELEALGEDIIFNKPSIPWERATESKTTEPLSSTFFAQHMRNPVYFDHAVQRLTQQFPSCIFLEAGSSSTITSMASRALGAPASSHFQAVTITGDNGLKNITDISINLWKNGVNTAFWAHHPDQTYEYAPLLLPPYQFEKSRHWLDLKTAPAALPSTDTKPAAPAEEIPKGLFTFVGYQDDKQHWARFRINTMTKKYEDFISGHLIVQTAPICPATLEVDMAIEALNSLRPDFVTSNLLPQIHNVDNHAPICINPAQSVWLDLKMAKNDTSGHTWEFQLVSTGAKSTAGTVNVTGTIKMCSASDPKAHAEFARFERFVAYQRCLDVLDGPGADEIMQGRSIYKMFAEIVDYGEEYRGLQRLVGKGNESAGRVVKKYTGETWLDTHLSDCFSQVGGIWVNCMTDRSPNDMYIANGFEQWIRSPKVHGDYVRPETWDVYALHQRASDKAFVTDIFIFDPLKGTLVEVILGINYAKVAKLSMSKILSRLTVGGTQNTAAPSQPARINAPAPVAAPTQVSKAPKTPKAPKPKKASKSSGAGEVTESIRAVLADLSGLEIAEIGDEVELANIGIDSLMGMEMAKELETKFKCSLPEDQLVEVTTFKSLVECVQSALGPVAVEESDDEDEDEDEDDEKTTFDSPGTKTPVDSATSVSDEGSNRVELIPYLADFLGVEEDEIPTGTLLRDLGVDSLLSTELVADMAGKFDVHLPEDMVIEELTVNELDAKINGAKEAPKPAAPAAITPLAQPSPTSDASNLNLPASTVLESFGAIKMLTDQYIADFGCADYMDVINPKQVQMCIALIVDAFEQLGCPLRTARPGQVLGRIPYLPQHGHLADYLYMVLERDARLIDIQGDSITRTAISPPTKSSQELLQGLIKAYPNHNYANKLTYFTGSRLVDVLQGKSDGIKLIFGTEEGRDLVSGLYGDSMLNALSYKMMEDFLKKLIAKLPTNQGPLKILEMGAGTGGTTKLLVPVLASLNVPVEYTYTDLSPSFTAAARKRFKPYPFMKFRVHDIEKAPADDLLNSQHLVIASNAVHATHSLLQSLTNIRKALRPDGFLMMLEMTQTLVWIDVIFGLLEGWWLFDDGRRHAIAHQDRWETDLHAAGFGHVDYTDGHRPEVEIQRIIVAMASHPARDRLPIPVKPAPPLQLTDTTARQAAVEQYIHRSTQGFQAPVPSGQVSPASSGHSVLITGATGSLGSHLVEYFARRPDIDTVVCLNRHGSGSEPGPRQREALDSRGIPVDQALLSKIKVFETDTSKPNLGLSTETYNNLVQTVTHMLHNAWPMSGKRPVKGFEAQFQVMRNLIDFAREISCQRTAGFQVGFQFISSIATVGHYPLRTGRPNVPEERVTIDSVLPNGYGDAKFVCERMLDETLHKYPQHFRPMAVRLGQVAGSKTSGYWNPLEHLSFLVKSAQTLKAFPAFDGLLSWTPVNDVAATLGELLLAANQPYPIYHIDNPVRQPWREMIPILTDALNIPPQNVIPFADWVQRVRTFPGSTELDNPAAKLIEFLDGNFERMSCGGLLLDTDKSREHSPTLAGVGPVSEEVARKYIQAWKTMKFLH